MAMAALFVAVPALIPLPLAAQGTGERRPAPLSKADLVRVLSRGTYTRAEVVSMIQRSCLSFIPSVGDRQDLRRLGAEVSIFAAIDACASGADRGTLRESSPTEQRRDPTPETEQPVARSPDIERPSARPPDTTPQRAPSTDFAAPPLPPLLASLSTMWLTTPVSETVALTVELRRDQRPQPGVRLVLRGTEHIAGGPAEALQATTDEGGVARFQIPAGPVINRYPLRIAAIGEELSGESSVTLDVVAGSPVRVEVDPNPLVLAAGQADPVVLTATAFDRFGNPVPRATLTLRPRAAGPQSGVEPPLEEITRTTDEDGTTPFVVRSAPLLAGHLLEVSSGRVVLASIPVRSPAADPGPPDVEGVSVEPATPRPDAELDPPPEMQLPSGQPPTDTLATEADPDTLAAEADPDTLSTESLATGGDPEAVGVPLPADTTGAPAAEERRRYEWVGPPDVADEIRPRKELAEAAMARGDHVSALQLYREIVGLAPEDPVAWFELGRALGLSGHWEEARSVFIHAADLDRARRRSRPDISPQPRQPLTSSSHRGGPIS